MSKDKLNKAIARILFVAVGGSAGFFAATLGMKSAKTFTTAEMIILLLFSIPAFFLVIGIHEGGHALAGTWMKFDFRMYVVGPFMWDKEETGWKFKWNKNVNLSGGLVICLPTTSEHIATRFAWYAAGGPLASLIFAGSAYALRNVINMLNSSNGFALHILASVSGMLAIFSALIFLVTAMPMHSGGFYSDGARVYRFLRGGETSRFELLVMKIFTSSSGGVRPRLLNIDELNEALQLANKLNAPMRVYLYAYFYQVALDKGDFDEAELHLKQYIREIEQIPRGIRNAVWLDAAFFYAFARKDITLALHYWTKFESSAFIPKAQILATKAAICSLQNDFRNMNIKIDEAITELPNMIDRGANIALHEKLMQLKLTYRDTNLRT